MPRRGRWCCSTACRSPSPFAGYIPWSAIDPAQLASVRVTRGGGAGAFRRRRGRRHARIWPAPGRICCRPSRWRSPAARAASLEASAGLAARLGDGFRYRQHRGMTAATAFCCLPLASAAPVDIPAAYSSWAGNIRAVAPREMRKPKSRSRRAFDDRAHPRPGAGRINQTGGADASARLIHNGDREGDWGRRSPRLCPGARIHRAVSPPSPPVAPPRGRRRSTSSARPRPGLARKSSCARRSGRRMICRFGLDARHGDGTTNERFRFQGNRFTRLRTAGGSVATVGGYAEDSWTPTEALTLTGGIRLDYSANGRRAALREIETATPAPGTAFDRHRRPRWLGAARRAPAPSSAPPRHLALRSAAYSGFRVPTPNELYRPFRVGADATAANPGILTSNASRGAEIGLGLAAAVHRPSFGHRLCQ